MFVENQNICMETVTVNLATKGAVTCGQVEICLGYMNTSTCIENNISTWAEIKNTICSMFICHDI